MAMKSLFAMRRANGDWFALDDGGRFRVPVFPSARAAMIARSRDTGMECFVPAVLDEDAFRNVTNTDEGKACFWLVADPLMKLSRGLPLDRQQLELMIKNGAEQSVRSKAKK
jgi:hypothetical protein